MCRRSSCRRRTKSTVDLIWFDLTCSQLFSVCSTVLVDVIAEVAVHCTVKGAWRAQLAGTRGMSLAVALSFVRANHIPYIQQRRCYLQLRLSFISTRKHINIHENALQNTNGTNFKKRVKLSVAVQPTHMKTELCLQSANSLCDQPLVLPLGCTLCAVKICLVLLPLPSGRAA